MRNVRKRSNWSIQIRPTPTGVTVKTDSYVDDVLADELGRYIEKCLVEFSQTLSA